VNVRKKNYIRSGVKGAEIKNATAMKVI